MLEWHRREEKSAWWEYFRLCDLSDDELQEDRNALGGLAYVAEVDHIKRSTVHRYRFPPQDHAIDRAQAVRDPRTGHSAGTVVAFGDIDAGRCTEGYGISVQSQSPERRGVAGTMRGCDRRQPGSVPSAMQDTTADRAYQRFLSLSGDG